MSAGRAGSSGHELWASDYQSVGKLLRTSNDADSGNGKQQCVTIYQVGPDEAAQPVKRESIESDFSSGYWNRRFYCFCCILSVHQHSKGLVEEQYTSGESTDQFYFVSLGRVYPAVSSMIVMMMTVTQHHVMMNQ